MENMQKLFAAHSPASNFMEIRCTLCYGEHLSIATLLKSKDHIVPPFTHSHEEYEFLAPHTPIPFLVNEGAIYFGEVGWVFPVQSGRSHGIKYELSDISHSSIVIRKEYMDALLAERGCGGAAFNYEFRLSDELKFYLHTFKSEYNKGAQCDAQKLRHLSALICLELIHAGTDPAQDTRKEKHSYQRGIRTVAEFLNDNYQQDISVEELAKMYGFSKSYFIEVFKRNLGESPHAYLNKLRISRAKLLLETTNDPICEIAEQCGFKKANTFTSLFKTLTGKTPTAYRQALDL